MKINIRDETQDGRFTITLPEKNVEVRVAIAPSEFGESGSDEASDPDAISIFLWSTFGTREDDLEIARTELKRPNGMIFKHRADRFGKDYHSLRVLKAQKSRVLPPFVLFFTSTSIDGPPLRR